MPKKKIVATKSTSPTQKRLWLMYPPRLIKKPFIWEVGHKFNVTRERVRQIQNIALKKLRRMIEKLETARS